MCLCVGVSMVSVCGACGCFVYVLIVGIVVFLSIISCFDLF